MVDIYTKSERSQLMSKIRVKKTSPEIIVAKMLRSLRVKFRQNVKDLPGQPDFVVPKAKAVIFVHGCFWHHHHNCKRAKLPKSNTTFWRQKINANRKRDQRVARKLRADGWHVLTLWQCRLKNQDRVLKRLQRTFDI